MTARSALSYLNPLHIEDGTPPNVAFGLVFCKISLLGLAGFLGAVLTISLMGL